MRRLYFDTDLLDSDLRALIGSRIVEDDVFDLLGEELTLLPEDYDLRLYSKLNAISLDVFGALPYLETQTDAEIQNHSSFSVEIEIYTKGTNKKKNNRKLQNIIIELLQNPVQMASYKNNGLILVEVNEGDALIEDTFRSVLRFSAICDNAVKYIYSKI